jgi:hypothetical protein
MLYLKQLGVKWVSLGARPETATAEGFIKMREQWEAGGFKVYNIGSGVGPSGSLHNMPEVTLNLPGRDQKIEEYLNYIRYLSKAGIPYSTYTHMGNGIWRSGREVMPRGYAGSSLDLSSPNAQGAWSGKTYKEPLSHGRVYTKEEIWDNYTYFIKKVVPVAEEAGVRIGIHPDDPPIPLVISPHGRGVKARVNARMWRGLPGAGSFAVVNPQGEGRRLPLYSWGYRGQIADLARMPGIVGRALPWLHVDRRRIYANCPADGSACQLFYVALLSNITNSTYHAAQLSLSRRFGAGIGFLRVGGGAHFFTDVVFAGVFMFLVVWTLHGMIYRWRTRAEEGVIERGLAQIGEALRGALAGLAGWITGRAGRGS